MLSTSKDWKIGCHKIWTYKNFIQNTRSIPQLKIKNQIMAYRWTFGKDPLNVEKIMSAIHD